MPGIRSRDGSSLPKGAFPSSAVPRPPVDEPAGWFDPDVSTASEVSLSVVA